MPPDEPVLKPKKRPALGVRVRSEKEVRKLRDELERLVCFIAEFGTGEEYDHEDVRYASDITDALSWVLGEITTEQFMSSDYINIESLRRLAKKIEERTGRKLEDYR